MHPPGSRPGINSLAIIPAISPKITQLSMPTVKRLLYPTAYLGLLELPQQEIVLGSRTVPIWHSGSHISWGNLCDPGFLEQFADQ